MLDIAKLRAELEKNRGDPGKVAFMIRSNPEIEEAGLAEIAWWLSKEDYGCSYRDVAGLIDDLERWRRKERALREKR